MKDHWMNVGHEEEELKPYIEPEADFSDSSRIGVCACVSVCVCELVHCVFVCVCAVHVCVTH